MLRKSIDSLSFFHFENLSNFKQISHFISTRQGGFSNPPYDSLNLAFHVGDEPQTILKNRELLASSLDIPLSNFTTAQQVHDADVAVVTESMCGNGALDFESAIPATDAMVTEIPKICLMILTADCVPILFFDPKKKVIGVAHAGWKGTGKQIAQKTVQVMQKKFACSPSDILVGLGPSIGPCCYEVGAEVIIGIERTFANQTKEVLPWNSENQGYFNLWEANKIQLVQEGILERNIEVTGFCTRCHSDIFYSARQTKGATGRFGTGIMLR
ncbi:MAG: peptidoglycan editing factor PgeF [bacterium]|nr:peptidoglycan editing factor PgeF [bacterium]